MALHDITLTYGGLSVTFRNWKSADLPRSRRTFVSESSDATSGNLIKAGTSFEIPYMWTIADDLYQTEYDKVQMIWEILDYARRNQRPQIGIDVNVTSNVFLAAAHPYQNNDVVTASGGTLPAPLVSTRDYWIVNRTTNSYQLSETPNGSPVDITTTGSNSVLNTQLFVRLDDESEEIAEAGKTASTKTRSTVAGTTPREANGGVYYYARFLADWVAPPDFGKAYSSVRYSPNNSVRANQVLVRAVGLVLQDTGVKI